MKRIMKLTFAFALLLALSVNCTVYAAANLYSIPELGLALDLPSRYYVIVRDTPQSSPVFQDLDLDYSSIMDYLKSSDIYMFAAPANKSEQIMVHMSQSILSDFNKLDASTLYVLMTEVADNLEKSGINILHYEPYTHSQTMFIKVQYYDPSTSTRGLLYYTTVDSMQIILRLFVLDSEISALQDSTMDTIVDSIQFDPDSIAPPVIPPYTIESPESYLPTYSHNDTQTRIPAQLFNDTFTTSATPAFSIAIVLWALIPGFIAKNKERSFWFYFLLSFVITPLITTIITLCLKKPESDSVSLWLCGFCNTTNNDHYDRCKKCGKYRVSRENQLDVSSNIIRSSSYNQASGLWTCHRCGTQNKSEYGQCKKCGVFRSH